MVENGWIQKYLRNGKKNVMINFTLKQLLPGSQKSADYPYQAFKRSF